MPPPRRKFGATQKERIFLAVLPDAESAAHIHAFASELKVKHNLTGTQILPEHLHITLFHLGDWISLPQDVVTIASTAAAQVEFDAFEIACTRTESFRNSTGIYPFVLLAEQGATALRALHTELGAALMKNGLGGATRGEFKPHVTLLRDKTKVKPAKVEPPILWRAREVVLVHSLLGKTTHIHIGRWPLRDRETA